MDSVALVHIYHAVKGVGNHKYRGILGVGFHVFAEVAGDVAVNVIAENCILG